MNLLDAEPPSPRATSPIPAWAAFVAMAALTAVYFWPVLSKQFSFSGDYTYYYYPFAQFLARSLAHGELPLWNPFLVTGYHFLANPQTQVFYPPSWLLPLFMHGDRLPYYAVELFTIAHYPLAGLFTFMYVRRLGAPAPAAFLSGAVFTFLGFMWAHQVHKSMVETVTWLPLLFFALEGLLARPSLPRTLLAACAAALFFLGGFVPYVYMATPFIAIYCLLGLRRAFAEPAGPGSKLAYIILAGALALGLVAVQLMPTLELAPLSYRQDFDLGIAAEGSLWPGYLLTAFLPMAYFGGRPYSLDEMHFSLGVIPIMLAGLSLAAARPRRRWFWLTALVVALLMALGTATPLFGFLWAHLPGMNVTRVPGRYVLIVDLALAVLAGLGAATLGEAKPTSRPVSPWLLALYLALGLAGLAWGWQVTRPGYDPAAWRLAPDIASQLALALGLWFAGLLVLALTHWRRFPRRLALWCFVGLALAEILAFPRTTNWSQRPPESFFPLTPNVRFLQTQIPPGRLGIYNQLTFADRFEMNAGAVFSLPTTAVLDTVGEARLFHFFGFEDASLTADMVGERFLSSPQPQEELPQAKYRPFEAWPGQPVRRDISGLWQGRVRQVQLVSSLAFAEKAGQGEEVAEIVLWAGGKPAARLPVRAGVESSEWSVDKPGQPMAHGPAAIARSWPVGDEGYQGHAYLAHWDLDPPVEVERIEVASQHPNAVLKVEGLALNGTELFNLGQRYTLQAPGLYRNNFTMPRARLLKAWRVVSGEEEAKHAVKAADLTSEVVLEKEPRFPAGQATEPPQGSDQVSIVEDGMKRVALEVQASAPSVLFLADTFYPGWRVEVDGRPGEVLRANFCYRGVALGPGAHRVIFSFRPAWWVWASGISLGAWALLAVLGIGAWLVGRRGRPQA